MNRKYRLTAEAQREVDQILEWTDDHFGETARRRYIKLLLTAFRSLASKPDLPGSRQVPSVQGIRLCHLRHVKSTVKHPRHFIAYRELEDGRILILRVLHDSMDIGTHLEEK